MEEPSYGLNAKAVRLWLAERGEKQRDLAEKAGIMESHLSSMMTHAIPATGKMLFKIHDATGIPTDDLRIAFEQRDPRPYVRRKKKKARRR